jgi:ribonuclease P protein component
MLHASNRLRHRRDIDRVYKRGVYGSSEGIISLKALRVNTAPSRAVVVVSKKIDKRAVVRNRLRRSLLGALQQIWATVPDGYDIVISVHRDYRDLSPEQLKRLLKLSLTHARILLA